MGVSLCSLGWPQICKPPPSALWPFHLSLPSARITGMHHYTQLPISSFITIIETNPLSFIYCHVIYYTSPVWERYFSGTILQVRKLRIREANWLAQLVRYHLLVDVKAGIHTLAVQYAAACAADAVYWMVDWGSRAKYSSQGGLTEYCSWKVLFPSLHFYGDTELQRGEALPFVIIAEKEWDQSHQRNGV
jgi:hypothetical protein